MEVYEWNDGGRLWDLMTFVGDRGAFLPGVMFRGQSNSEWKLIPALYRRAVHIFGEQSQDELYVLAERRMLDTFFDRALLLLPNFSRNELIDRIIAQHYGVPTQLLDWTLDPFVAIYFAVSDDAQAESDSSFYFVGTMQSYDSRRNIGFPYSGKLAKLIPPVLDERIRTQKSVFTLHRFGSDAEFVPLDDRTLKFSPPRSNSHPDDEVSIFGKVIIPKDRKRQLLEQLLAMGIDASLMFPGLQGIGERIASHVKLKNYGGDGLF